jgi:hypothetical protein
LIRAPLREQIANMKKVDVVEPIDNRYKLTDTNRAAFLVSLGAKLEQVELPGEGEPLYVFPNVPDVANALTLFTKSYNYLAEVFNRTVRDKARKEKADRPGFGGLAKAFRESTRTIRCGFKGADGKWHG